MHTLFSFPRCIISALAILLFLPAASLAAPKTINGYEMQNVYGAGGNTYTAHADNGELHIVSGADAQMAAFGGNVYGGSSWSGSAYNTVEFLGGTVNDFMIAGGYVGIGPGNANNNAVLVDGGTHDSGGGIYGGYSANDRADNNTVTLVSGTVNSVFGGSGPVGASNNTVNIYRGVIIKETGSLAGGLGGGTFTDNTLNLYGWSGSVLQLGNFQNYNFYLDGTVRNGDTILNVAGYFDPFTDISGATVHVGVMGGGSRLKVNDTITLIKAANTLISTGINTTTSGEGMVGVSTRFSFDLTTDSNSLFATVTQAEGNPQLKSLAESRVAGLGMLTQGADMLTGQGIPQLKANAMNTTGPAAFATVGGSSLRYNSGSHVDVDGFNAIAGLGWNVALNEGRNGSLLLGAFFETGWGSYDSYNSFSDSSPVNGGGDTNYYGGGILGRYDSAPVGPGGFYLEASARAGRVKTDYDSSDFNSSTGQDVDFDSSATYYGAHAGLGYIWNITEKASLDIYTKYLWTHQDSDSVTIQGDSIKFKSMDSHRWRGGARFGYDLTTDQGSTFTPYAGAAYEHEFDSEAKASSNGDAIDAPDVEGGTGIGEVGLTFKAADSGFSVDVGVQGYTGKREGVGGGFQFKWEF